MTYPADLTLVTVTHKVVDTAGRPLKGYIDVAPTEPLVMEGGTILPRPDSPQLNADGTYTMVLPAVDDPKIKPQGAGYRVTERVTNGRTYHVAPLMEHAPGPVDASVVMTPKPKAGGGITMMTGPATDESMKDIVEDPDSQFRGALMGTIGAEVGEVVNDPDAPFRQAVGGEIDAAMYEKAPVALSTNLADDRDLTPGYPSNNDGRIVTVDYSKVTGFLPITPGATYTSRGLTRRSFYAADKSFISGADQTQTATVTWTAPANARFVRYTATNAYWGTQAQVNAGPTLQPFEHFRAYVPGDQVANLPTDALADDAVTVPKAQFIHPSTNLFNEDLRTLNQIFPSGGAAPVHSDNYDTSDWIAVTPGQVYALREIYRVAWFNGRRQHISTVSTGAGAFEPEGTTVTAPAGAVWARVSVAKQYLGSARLNVGGTLLPYEPGGGTLAGYVRVPGVDTSTPNRPVLDVRPDQPTVAAEPYPDMYTEVMASTPGSFYGLYDALVAAHPGYVTRTQLGTEASEHAFPIYQYTFDPTLPEDARPAGSLPVPVPTIVVLTSSHGSEKAGAYAAYHLHERICNAWDTDPMLALLRQNVRFVTVPLVNPWAFNEHARGNSNGVDVNRNYPEGWTQGTPGTPTYGGTAPLSEPEAQAVDQVMQANRDAIAVVDFHNFTTAPVPYRFIWATSRVAQVVNVSSALIRRIDRLWKARYPFMDPDPDTYIGYVSQSSAGTTSTYAASLGFNAATFEICERVNAKDAPTNFDSDAMTMGYEAWANYVLMLTDHFAR